MKLFGHHKSSSKSKITKPSPSTEKRKSATVTRTTTNGDNMQKPPSSVTPNNEKPEEPTEKLETHIEVCARIRPLQILRVRDGYFSSPPRRKGANTATESWSTAAPDDFVAWDVNEDGDTAGQSPNTELIQGRTHSYTLDRVYGTDATTRDLYDNSIHPLVKSAMEGYHSSILAYGQTSTGKTFTMTGTKDSPGLIPLCIRDCFRYVKECQESREYLIRVSYLEVYKEHIRDLLAPTPVPIRLFDGPNGLIIKGLKEEVVTSPERVFTILKQGEARRQVGATHMNQHSSRSHVMVRLWIESTEGGKGPKSGSARVSSLSLVDLAGSESVKLNGTERRQEGHYINKSLMTLGQVVLSLSENKTGHIPYRDSKLTRLLQPSLSGNAQMVLLCCIHPHSSHIEESHNTFKFATRAKKIKQKAVINTTPDEKTLLQNYRDEIEDLKKQLADAKKQQAEYLEEKEKNAMPSVTSADSSAGEIKELVQAIKTMEKLILKSHPHAISSSPTATRSTTSLDDDEDDEEEVDLLSEDDDKDDLDLLLDDVPPKTPEKDDVLQSELSRIRGLLDSVLQKRGGSSAPLIPDSPFPQSPSNELRTERELDFSTPPSVTSPQDSLSSQQQQQQQQRGNQEVETLRKQLEQQELASNLRKADSSFLQAQLKEKDQLLEEVSKVLEAVENRQAELEKENADLRMELELLKARFVVI